MKKKHIKFRIKGATINNKMPLLANIHFSISFFFIAIGAIVYFITKNAELGGFIGAAWFVFFLLTWAWRWI